MTISELTESQLETLRKVRTGSLRKESELDNMDFLIENKFIKLKRDGQYHAVKQR